MSHVDLNGDGKFNGADFTMWVHTVHESGRCELDGPLGDCPAWIDVNRDASWRTRIGSITWPVELILPDSFREFQGQGGLTNDSKYLKVILMLAILIGLTAMTAHTASAQFGCFGDVEDFDGTFPPSGWVTECDAESAPRTAGTSGRTRRVV